MLSATAAGAVDLAGVTGLNANEISKLGAMTAAGVAINNKGGFDLDGEYCLDRRRDYHR